MFRIECSSEHVFAVFTGHGARVRVQESTGEAYTRGSSSAFSNRKAQVQLVAQWTMHGTPRTIAALVTDEVDKFYTTWKKRKEAEGTEVVKKQLCSKTPNASHGHAWNSPLIVSNLWRSFRNSCFWFSKCPWKWLIAILTCINIAEHFLITRTQGQSKFRRISKLK